MNEKMRLTIKRWIPVAFLAIMLSGLIYLTVQQSIRQSANDPQIQMAEDAASAIANGTEPQLLVPQGSVDIAKSLAPYLVLYSETGSPLAGNGLLNGTLPSLPAGVFTSTRESGEDRITWQPQAGVRSAIVVVHIASGQGGYVMVGRSLREAEQRENSLTLEVGILLVITLIGTLVLKFII
jgi:hypothetical protein